jgi:hypothetical protein
MLVLSIHLTTAKVGRHPKICHPDWSGGEGRDLQFAFMEKQNPEAIRPRHFRCPGK